MKYKVIIKKRDGTIIGLKEFPRLSKAKNYAKLVTQSCYYKEAEVVKTVKNYSHL